MTVSVPPSLARWTEAWTLTSELEGERASSFRQGRWCRVLLETGFPVVAFNLRGAMGLSQNVFTTLDEFAAFQERVRASARPMASVREGWVVRLVRHLKHLVLADLWLPNVWLLLIALLSRLRQSTAPVVIMASSPPFSVAVVGAVVKTIYPKRIHFVVDMRDAWALHTGLGGIRLLKRMIERWVLRRADDVITVSHGLSREFSTVYRIPLPVVLYNVATHYFQVPDPEPLAWDSLNPAIRPNARKYVYTGSTPEGHFALRTIVAGVKEAVRRGVRADSVQLIFVGACDALMREVQAQAGCDDVIVFVAHQPHRMAQRIQQQADGLIFLAYNGEGNKGVVSTKFFEYLALQKSILPLSVQADSDVDRLLERFAEHSLCIETSDEIASSLSRLHNAEIDLPCCRNSESVKVLLRDYFTWSKSLKE